MKYNICYILKLPLLLLFFILIKAQPIHAEKTFIIAFAHSPNEDPQYMFYERIYTEIFKKLGYNFEYVVVPSKRATKMANSGVVDGEPQRIKEYAINNPNLIRVKEPIFENRTFAFTANPNIQFSGLSSLKNSLYQVDYLRGSKWSKDKLTPLVNPKNLSTVNSIEQGFKKLSYGRTDILISLEVYASNVLMQKEFRGLGIISLGVIGSNLSYPYVHKSHKTIAIKIAEILKKMKKSGRYYKILKETMPFMITINKVK